jgi:predicted ATPase with chaperone activity
MALESKMILISLAALARETQSIEKVYSTIADMADADGLKLPPLIPDGGKKDE